ncbi:MAG: DMT family transporter [Pyrinomonadaceae bacterium]
MHDQTPTQACVQTQRRQKEKVGDYLALISLAALWGGSFLFMRVAAPEFGPAALMAGRVLIASVLLLPLLLVKGGGSGIHALRKRKHELFVLGVMNSALPFLLFAYAALSLTAGFSSILNATSPLWGALIAWLWMKNNPNAQAVTGLCIGFFGVVILVASRESFAAVGATLGVGACLLASCCYGISATYTKRFLAEVDSLTLAAGTQLASVIVLVPIALILFPSTYPSLAAWIALLALGIACTAIAYLLYFRLIRNLGATGALTVTYLVPIFGMTWGVIFLQEEITYTMVVGTAVVFVGVGLTTGAVKSLKRSSPTPNT